MPEPEYESCVRQRNETTIQFDVIGISQDRVEDTSSLTDRPRMESTVAIVEGAGKKVELHFISPSALLDTMCEMW